MSKGDFLDAVCGLPVAMASLVAEHRLISCSTWALGHSSVVAAHGFSCSVVCGIFLDLELNLYFLHWQVDSLPLSHQGRPVS